MPILLAKLVPVFFFFLVVYLAYLAVKKARESGGGTTGSITLKLDRTKVLFVIILVAAIGAVILLSLVL